MKRQSLPEAIYRLTVPQHWIIPGASVLIGAAAAWRFSGRLRPGLLLATVFCAWMCLCAVNTLNNYRDYKTHNDTAESCVLHPLDNPLVSFGLPPWVALVTAGVCLLLSGAVGVYIVFQTDPKVLWFAAIALAAILGYTLAPIPFSAIPAGELLSGTVEGAVLSLASWYIQLGSAKPCHIWLFLPPVFAVGEIMLTNNATDIEKDTASGRHTLPSYIGRKNAKRLVVIMAAAGALCILLTGILALHSVVLSVTVFVITLAGLFFPVSAICRTNMEQTDRPICMRAACSIHLWLTVPFLSLYLLDLLRISLMNIP